MHLFDRANEALRDDLTAYLRALETIVDALPRARELCACVVKETRLVRALLAFYSGPHVGELGQIAFHMTNLWPYREQPFAKTLGFADEIGEAQRQRDEAMRAIRLLLRKQPDPLVAELETSFGKIAQYLQDEQQLLEECDALIQPHATNMDMTCKRLNLLVAIVDARLADSPEQRLMLGTYNEALELLRDWERGVPLESRGVAILARCLDMLNHIDGVVEQHEHVAAILLGPPQPA